MKIDAVQTKGYYSTLGYRSVRLAAREGRFATLASGDAHSEYDRLKLINQSRQFWRDNPIYSGMIDRSCGYIIGNGFTLQCKTGDTDLNSDIEKRWKKYWKRPEIKNISSGRECEKMICRETLVTGDVGILKINNGKFQIIEAEQICGEKGTGQKTIKKNSYGAPVGFWVGGYNTSGGIDKRTIRLMGEDVFLFISSPDRPSSLRSVPPCQAAFPMLHRINDVCDSEAIAWQLLARLAVSITRKQGKELAYIESAEDKKRAAKDNAELKNRIQELDYALIFHGEENDEIKGIERNVPGKNFSESLVMFLRLLGLPLGLPLEIILLDWTKSNYSQSRAVLEQAFVTFINRQFKIADFMMTPIFEWWLRGEIAAGLKVGGEYVEKAFEHNWIMPTFPWIDQLKEALAWGEKLDRGLTLHQKALKSLGVDREDEMDERQKEILDAIKRAKQIKDDTGVDVPWQIFAGLKADPKPIATEDTEDTEGKDDKKKKDDDEN
jgi:capsid protein